VAARAGHNADLQEAETARLHELAKSNEVLLSHDKLHHEVIRQHAVEHARDRMDSFVRGAGLSKDVFTELDEEQVLVGCCYFITPVFKPPAFSAWH